MLVGTLTAQAGDYTYLTFETTDGAKASVSVEGLTLSISGNNLTAGTQTFTLSNLSKMYFSTSGEMTTGIEGIENSQFIIDNSMDIYDLKGHKVTKAQMKKGVYIVKAKNKTYKIVVK